MTELAAPSPQRDWWLRTALVLQAPRSVFSALRPDSDEDASARAEPVLAILILAGMASVLSSSAASHLLDDGAFDGLLIAVWAFLGGAVYGLVGYWICGVLLHFGLTALGSAASFRRTRHLLAFSLVPLALSLVLWLPRLALYGGDSFRYGGSDTTLGSALFGWLEVAFALWTLALLAVGVRAVERWTWTRSVGAVGIAAALPALAVLAVYGLL